MCITFLLKRIKHMLFRSIDMLITKLKNLKNNSKRLVKKKIQFQLYILKKITV